MRNKTYLVNLYIKIKRKKRCKNLNPKGYICMCIKNFIHSTRVMSQDLKEVSKS